MFRTIRGRDTVSLRHPLPTVWIRDRLVSARMKAGSPFSSPTLRANTFATFGTGLVGYTWEENGPALTVQCGRETLEQAVEKMASLPFVDVLYIRCDWRDV